MEEYVKRVVCLSCQEDWDYINEEITARGIDIKHSHKEKKKW